MPDELINPAFPQRKRPTHQPLVEQHNRAVIVFLTVCSKDRHPIFATPIFHRAFQTAWRNAGNWLVGRYVIMPDHIHLFCAPGVLPVEPLRNWVRYWKSAVCKNVGAPTGVLWQRDFWDTQLRRHENYSAKWEYVRNNPVRAGLVAGVDDWPYRGELNVLRWHE